MIPIYLDPAKVHVAIVGRGRLALQRFAWLKEAGAVADVWSDAATDELRAIAEIKQGLPTAEDLKSYHMIWVSDLPAPEAERVAKAADEAGVLANVEDRVLLCDFHTPALVRRGRLLLAAGTGGTSPAVARAARERLEDVFSHNWGVALEEISLARSRLRERHAALDLIVADARERLTKHGLI